MMENAKLGRPRAHLLITLLILAVISASNSAPHGNTQTMIYLNPLVRNSSSESIADEAASTDSIFELSNLPGVNVIEELDEETPQLKRLLRYRAKDVAGFGAGSRSKRFILQGNKWDIKDPSYKVTEYPSYMGTDDVDKELAKAFALWSEHTDLSFTQKRTGDFNIEVRFKPIDGRYNTLAWAGYPKAGIIEFDDDEPWGINGYDIFDVAVHEMGHALGIKHSDNEDSFMSNAGGRTQLGADDIQAIQALYGNKTKVVSSGDPGKSPTTEEEIVENLCLDSKIDTAFRDSEDSTYYVFRGNYYWKLTEDIIAANYPRPISKSWPGLPGKIDAAFTYKDGKTYFFKKSMYWVYQGMKMDGKFPKDIKDGFAGIPDNLDAALALPENGTIYFYKGSEFWELNLQEPSAEGDYPKPLSNWEGVPNNIDAALQHPNGNIFFFKDRAYYRFNIRTFSVETAYAPAFPRSTAYWWFGCKSAPSGTVEDRVE